MTLLSVIRSLGLRLAYRAATVLVRPVAINFRSAADDRSVITHRLPPGWTPSGRVIDAVATTRSEAVTTPIPFSEANWNAAVRLQEMAMDLAASGAKTVELPEREVVS